MGFEIGDKVRSKTDHNLVGIVREVDIHDWSGTVKQIVTISDVFSNAIISIDVYDIEKIDEEKEAKDMTRYKVGDSVEHIMYGECKITSLESFENGYIDVFSKDRGGIVPVSISDIKKMTKYEVGDLVRHRIHNESIVVNVSDESGYINIVPLTGFCRGQTKTVRIENVKRADDKLIISIEDYNEMANTIENLKKENIKLKEDAITLVHEKWNLKNKNLPEVKSVLYHEPATIIFWKDGTKTVVKVQKNEKYDNEKGFVMAYLKKILGNEGNYYEEIKRWTDIK